METDYPGPVTSETVGCWNYHLRFIDKPSTNQPQALHRTGYEIYSTYLQCTSSGIRVSAILAAQLVKESRTERGEGEVSGEAGGLQVGGQVLGQVFASMRLHRN